MLRQGEGEFVTQVSGTAGWYIDSLRIETNRGRSIEAGNSSLGFPFQFTHGKIVALEGGNGRKDKGRDGLLHWLKVHYASKTEQFT